MAKNEISPHEVVRRIRASGMTIYGTLTHRPDLYLTSAGLEEVLRTSLVGLSLDYPIRTRSKVVKTAVCEALGYPVPGSFMKVRPRFLGQNFDIYAQKENNLQIWNEEISHDRRYAIVRIDESLLITDVRVVTGDVIAALNTTGTLTQKYQAAARKPVMGSCLVSASDTMHISDLTKEGPRTSQGGMEFPSRRFLPIQVLYTKLEALIGQRIVDPGSDQERNRGAVLHEMVQKTLGYDARVDTGQFPDVTDQLLEIKLQTSPTIDLGLVRPDSAEPIELIPHARHCDVRYAVFYGTPTSGEILLEHVVVSTGEGFFQYFRKFEGQELNRKLQIRLPRDFFSKTDR